ncbi:MAG: hypothetical protein ACOYNK_05760 [Microbacteriaceae bacterium]
MKFSFKSAVALLAASTLPLIAVAPASAVIPRDAFTFDCNVGQLGEDDHALAPGESVTITFLNCDADAFEISDPDATGNATLGGSLITATPVAIATDPATVVVDEFAHLNLVDDTQGLYQDININLATTTADPSGVLLETESITLTSTPSFFVTPANSTLNDGGDALIGGVNECDVEVGDHPYSTVDITISIPGTYTFRVVDTDPVEEDMYFGIDSDFSPVGDNFIALYSSFNPSSVNSGVVGCNDDGDDAGVGAELWALAKDAAESRNQNDANVHTSTGFILDDQFAWFTATLQPGEYTMVGTLYDEYSESEWLTNLDDAEVTEASLTYEMWGPAGGLKLGHSLADTGVNPAFALWSGLALAGTGVAITAARRRAQRA